MILPSTPKVTAPYDLANTKLHLFLIGMVFLICYFSPFMKCIPAFDGKLRRIPKSHFCILQIWLSEMDCHPLLRLLHRRIGKPHQFKARQPRRYIHLNVDNTSVNPEGRRTIGLCKQRPSLPRFKYKKIITQERVCCLMILCEKNCL